ncbi:unnamed protein product [Polarella glacialis]|uniref:Uncharacterized protein n=1 Tax=Polarella glacialis TaxID=89957 RepID=A0A813J225_POLGL|nr:unnamed protein product [Polarella glacialis]
MSAHPALLTRFWTGPQRCEGSCPSPSLPVLHTHPYFLRHSAQIPRQPGTQRRGCNSYVQNSTARSPAYQHRTAVINTLVSVSVMAGFGKVRPSKAIASQH